MQIQRVLRTDPERVFIVAHNVDATSITTGQGGVFCAPWNAAAAGASVDGVQVVRVTTSADMLMFAGIAAQDIPSDGYGRFQVWGYANSVMVSHRAGNTTIGAGLFAETMLIPSVTLPGTFTSTALQDALSIIQPGSGGRTVWAMDTVQLSLSQFSTGSNVWIKAFIRGL